MSTSPSRREAIASVAGAATIPRMAAASPPATPVRSGLVQPSRAERALTVVGPALLEDRARAAMPPACFEYVHGAAGDEWTMRQNGERLRDRVLLPRRMAGFGQADTTSRLLGFPVPAPLYVCPMGAQDYANQAAEIGSVRGASAAGIPYMLSSASNRSLEQVAAAHTGPAPRLFAIYLNTDPAVNAALARRAKAAGYAALVMTVDSLGPGTSERFVAMGAPKTPIAGYGNFDPARGGSGTFLDLKTDFRPEDVALLRRASGLPVLVKGLLRPEDAERAVAVGAAGVVVSNHGGRTLDGAPAAIDALAPVVAAVKGRVPVLFDSGVRRGTDVIRALALGATAVGIGRPVLDALALGGGRGVADLLDWFKRDLATQMLLVGTRRIADIGPDLLMADAN